MPGKTFFAPQDSSSCGVIVITPCIGDKKATPRGGFFIAWAGRNMTEFTVTASAGGITTYRPYFVIANGSTNAYLALSAEL